MKAFRDAWFLLIPLLLCISLIVSAWYFSYPLTINFPADFVFYHISILYWIGLPLTLASMYLIALRSKNKNLRALMIIGIFLTLYSLAYFYAMLPGSDSSYFRALNEDFLKSSSLSANQTVHDYYEWPFFFILSKVGTQVSGLQLVQFEFVLYFLLGLLVSMSLYKYFSRRNESFAVLPLVGFSIAMFDFFDFQAVPFSLAFSLLLLLFMMEKRFNPKTTRRSDTVLYLLIFVGMCFVHLFVPLFFILYLIIQYLLTRSTRYFRLSFLTVVTYVSVQVFQAPLSFAKNVMAIITNSNSSDFSGVIQNSLTHTTVPFDSVAQVLSRFDVILVATICVCGFIILFLKKKLSSVDKAFFLSGLTYSVIGMFIPILGTRAIALFFIPVSLGIYSLIRERLGVLMKILFLVCLVLFVFVSIHQTFSSEVQFQTKESYDVENFLINNYNWTSIHDPQILSQDRVSIYLQTFESGNAYFYTDNSQNYNSFGNYDIIVYTLGLGKSMLTQNNSVNDIIENKIFDLTYTNGFSNLFIKDSNFTWESEG